MSISAPLLNFTVEWDGAEQESLAALLDKSMRHRKQEAGALSSHLISIRKKAAITEVISLWLGYAGAPQVIRESPTCFGIIVATSLALISPRSFKLIPDSAGEVLKAFEMKGFYRILSKKKMHELVGNAKVAQEGIQFMIEHKLIVPEGEDFRLLEVPLSNVKITFI